MSAGTRRCLRLLLLTFSAALILSACGNVKATESRYAGMYIWYLNEEENGLLHSDFTGSSGTESGEEEMLTTEEMIDSFLTALKEAPEGSGYKPLVDDDVLIREHTIEGGILTLNFSDSYAGMSSTREVLARAGIVRTFVQIPDVSGVHFLINGKEAVSPAGEVLGIMKEDTFVEDAGKQINAIQHVAINLYFTGENGKTLRREARSIYYTSSKPLEWAIVERIIAGPKVDGNYATVPANTQIISVTTENGTCYVNLNQTFITNALSIDAEIPVYSIVNSLIDDCSNISAVRISIEGESNIAFKQVMDLSHPFEANYTLVEATIQDA